MAGLALFLVIAFFQSRVLLSDHHFFNGKVFDGKVSPYKRARFGKKLQESGSKSVSYNPFNWRGALILSKGYFYLHNYEMAYRTLKKLLKYNPYNHTILNNLGIYALKAGHPSKTIDYWQRAMANNSDPEYKAKMKNNIKALKHGLKKNIAKKK
jgi:tetratricopeptide (TPR) repeat protein